MMQGDTNYDYHTLESPGWGSSKDWCEAASGCAQVAGLTGGPGLFPGVNVGENVAIFEQGARHVAKDIAGMGVANPSAALLSAAMMLRHLNLPGFSDRLERAVLDTISNEPNEIKTPDIGGTGTTRSFVNSIIDKL